jgi:hypothetical protein
VLLSKDDHVCLNNLMKITDFSKTGTDFSNLFLSAIPALLECISWDRRAYLLGLLELYFFMR